MAARASWKGFLQLNLISVPIRAYSSIRPAGADIRFHQVHQGCGQRIRHQRVCPVHGQVEADEIASGYEYEKGNHVEIDPDELRSLKVKSRDAIAIEAFTAPDEIDPIYYSGRSFFLVPAGPTAQKPYTLVHQIMREKDLHAVATMVLSGHDEVLLIRPLRKLLAATLLYYEEQIKQTAAFEDELGAARVGAEELRLAGNLVDATTAHRFDFSRYRDQYTKRVAELVESKLTGRKPEEAPREQEPEITDLMDALLKSLQEVRGGGRVRRKTA